MNRVYRLGFCKKCIHKSFSPSHGIICSLTNRQAEFLDSCENYVYDENYIPPKKLRRNTPLRNNDSRSSLKEIFKFFAFSLYLGLLITILTLTKLKSSVGEGLIIFALIIAVVSGILQLIILYQLWDFIISELKKQNLKSPIKNAGRAVGFMFIPIFNIYWFFKVFGLLPQYLNQIARTRNLKPLINDNLGYIFCGLILMALIPQIGIGFLIIANYILMPILIWKSIVTKEIMPPFENSIPVSEDNVNKQAIHSVRSFYDLFHNRGLGFNFKLPILYISASFLIILIQILLTYSAIRSLESNYFIYIFSIFILDSIIIFIVIFLCHLIENIYATAVSVGFMMSLKVILYTFLMHTLNLNNDAFGLTNIFVNPYVISSFIYGVLLIYGLHVTIEHWGLKFWGVILTITIAQFSSKLLMELFDFLINDDTYFAIKYYLRNNILNSVLLSLAFYFGFVWYLGSHGAVSGNKIKDNTILDDII